MKHNFKKIVSLFLTVVMLLGTVSAVIPFAASAEDDYVSITPNTDFVHNGVTYRFDVQTTNAESYAHVFADGSVEFKLADGDILWFPDVKATDSSAIQAKVTAIDRTTVNDDGGMANLFAGLVYGYDGTTEKGVGAIIKTNKNYRITNITRSSLAGHNGSDGYGSGGDYYPNNKRIKDGTASSAAGVYTSNSNNWKFGTTITFDISKSDDNVAVKLSGTETFADFSYAASDGYSFAGSVGFTPVWSATKEDRYSTFRFDKLTMTNCTVGGVAKDSYTVLERAANQEPEQPTEPEVPEGTVYLQKNTTATINGITYRFDTNKENDADSWARVNPDGSWEINIRNGDMLWFPDVALTDTSEVYLEITKTGTNTSDYFPGLAYGVTSSTASTWTSANVSVLRTYQNNNMRFRATSITRANAIKVSGSDYGNGGDTRPFNNEFSATDLWELIANPTNKNWNIGQTVYHKVSQTVENVVLEYGVPGYGAFVDPVNTSYANNYSGMYAVAGGSVGYTMVWQGNDTAHSQFRIEKITVTNATVGDQNVKYYSVLDGQDENDIYKLSANLSLEGVIGLNVKVNANKNIKDTATLVVTDKAGETVVNEALADLWNAENGYYPCTVPVNAKEMTDTFTVTLKDGENTITTVSNLSVKNYADQLMANDAYNDWDALVTAMLNYGAAAQKLFNYETEKLAATLEGFDFDMSAIGMPTLTGDKTIISDLSASLVLESDTALKLYFKNATDEELTVTVNDEAAELTKANDDLLCLTISDIAADELDDEFVVSINDGALVITISACEWAKTVVENETDANMITLAKALAAYATAAASKN